MTLLNVLCYTLLDIELWYCYPTFNHQSHSHLETETMWVGIYEQKLSEYSCNLKCISIQLLSLHINVSF